MQIGLVLLCLVSFITSARAEQFSIKCQFTQAYFLTFDTDDKRVVFESPAGSALKGRIDQLLGNILHFHLLKIGEEKFDLVWDGGQEKLTWVGIPGNNTRGTTSGGCNKTDLRSILSEYDRIAPY
jgi:hypothetical protein